ncbi:MULTISPECIES: hypothetical protein [unclassified Duganella]|uniref:hypothetical protein n=1 Tax=unclassified Duganella TaxID=2636909 RepID=UPI000E350DC4|nr:MULTISPECIES: hypothetical protein [unclassified Duganella]RFP16116.1 hypothetical protein D0T23_09490 [Duganella sp. BJB475]RFP32721.1 hypothetical protein D0T21_11145 [Duganella sp. BJB476]
MNSFVETISPAAKNHVLARIDYFSDLTLATLQSVRQLSEVNLQFSRDWLQDSTEALRVALLTPQAERTPSTEQAAHKLQAWQQQLNQIASEYQTSINQVVQQHAPQAARTATELAEAVTHKAVAQVDQQLRQSKAAGKEIIDQAHHFASVAAQNGSMAQPASMQSAEDQGNKN